VCNELWLIQEGTATKYKGSIMDYKKNVLAAYEKKHGGKPK
jgi:hypothetical protein